MRGNYVPSHTGLLEALVQNGFVATFDSATADEVALADVIGIVDVVGIVADIPIKIYGTLGGFPHLRQSFQNTRPLAVLQQCANLGRPWPVLRTGGP